jgi:GTPase Era involved in 16S rRNA processing
VGGLFAQDSEVDLGMHRCLLHCILKFPDTPTSPELLLTCTHSLTHPQVLVGNKSDMDESKRAVAYSRGQALADEFKLQFFETSAKSNTNVDDVFQVSPLPD